jgi:hypothetical protein
LIIRTIGAGNVYVYFGRPGVRLNSGSQPDLTFAGDEHEAFANAGHSLSGADLDGDGHADLVISSPHAYGGDGSMNQHMGPNPCENGTTYVQRGNESAHFEGN